MHPEGSLKLSEASGACGISVDTLRMLMEDRLLPGPVNSPSGLAYLRSDAVPTFDEVVELLEHALSDRVRQTQAVAAQMAAEVEAVANDLVLAAEDLHGVLGNDLEALRHGDTDPFSTLTRRLTMAVWDVHRYSEALRLTHRVGFTRDSRTSPRHPISAVM